MIKLSDDEKAVLDLLQLDFPLVSHPFRLLGSRLGISEDDVIELIHSLKERGVIRQIGAIYNTVRMGFKSTLVAAAVEESELDEVAASVSSHPGVSHNYRRTDSFNLWFTLALPEGQELEEHLERLRALKGVKQLLPLPSLKVYKRRVIFRLSGDKMNIEEAPLPFERQKIEHILDNDLLKDRLLYELQKDLFIETAPFEAISHKVGITEEQLFCFLAYLKEEGIMSRFAAIIRNQNVGYTSNAMVVWKVEEQRADLFGKEACRYDEVSHCYLRESHPEWDYNLYTMIHGKEEKSCEKIIEHLKSSFSPSDYRILYSTKEYKKQRVDYFSRGEFDI